MPDSLSDGAADPYEADAKTHLAWLGSSGIIAMVFGLYCEDMVSHFSGSACLWRLGWDCEDIDWLFLRTLRQRCLSLLLVGCGGHPVGRHCGGRQNFRSQEEHRYHRAACALFGSTLYGCVDDSLFCCHTSRGLGGNALDSWRFAGSAFSYFSALIAVQPLHANSPRAFSSWFPLALARGPQPRQLVSADLSPCF